MLLFFFLNFISFATNIVKTLARNTYSVGLRFRSKESEYFRAKSTKGGCFCKQWAVCKA